MSQLRTNVEHVLQDLRSDETGAVESAQIFAWIVVTVIAIMALGGLLQALGVDVIDWVRTTIGI